jgi:hypothetical protein
VKPAAGLLLIPVLALAGCGGGSKSASTTTVVTTVVTQATNPTGTAAVTTHGRFHYPPAVVKNYMRSCLKNNSVTQAYCACTLDKLSNNVSTADFARIGLSGGHIPRRIRLLIRRAAVACADKL